MNQGSILYSTLCQTTNFVFFVLMLLLAIIDLISYFWQSGKHHRNFKGEIVGLGIIGTFWGIFFGLQDFDTTHILESIPSLLNGLKTAFVTSIAGLVISMILTIIQTFIKSPAALRTDNPLQALVQDLLDATRASHERSLPYLVAIRDDVYYSRIEQRDDALKVSQIFENSFAVMNTSLQEALVKLSEGASKEIIKALEDVIRDFNANLTQQFGDNFQQLNAACLKLVEWQDNYKVIIEQVEATLKQSTASIEATDKTLQAIAEKNTEFEKLCVRLGDTISTSDRQTKELNDHLAQQKALAESVGGVLSNVQISIERVDQGIINADANFSKTTEVILANFKRLEEEQRDNISGVTKIFSDHCDTVVGNLNTTKLGLDEVTTKIQGSLTAQSQSLSELTTRTTEMTDKTRDELAASLRQLNEALTSLTSDFRSKYQEFLTRFKDLLP